MTKVLHRVGWIGLVLIAAFLLFAVANDLRADQGTGIPVDHAGAFTSIAGQSFDTVRQSTPGVARYVTTVEVGYALHELTFVVLFLALVLIPLRRRQAWAWWTCWAIMIANLGYTVTIARHDSTILTRSLIADIAVPVLLLLCAPAVFRPSGTARQATSNQDDQATAEAV
ncbi:MAG: hypothetical protein J2P17_14185 [Mycobacterium sp.]|nr:hypothetical protein [Mycobacterium sp.]